jgi:hypothetical protein
MIGYLLIVVGFIMAHKWFVKIPPTGYSVVAMGVAAGLMSFRTGTRWPEKLLWSLLLFTFAFTEFRAIDESERKSAANFASIAAGIQTSINEISGGHSYCYVFMGNTSPSVFEILLFPKGKDHVTEVHGYIGNLDYFDEEKAGKRPDIGQYSWNIGPVSFLDIGSGKPVGSLTVSPSVNYERFNIFINARNGAFTEFLRLYRFPHNHGWASAVAVTVAYYDGESGVAMRDVSVGFPIEKLEADSDWKTIATSPLIDLN